MPFVEGCVLLTVIVEPPADHSALRAAIDDWKFEDKEPDFNEDFQVTRVWEEDGKVLADFHYTFAWYKDSGQRRDDLDENAEGFKRYWKHYNEELESHLRESGFAVVEVSDDWYEDDR